MRVMKGLVMVLLVALVGRAPTASSEKATAAVEIEGPRKVVEPVGDESATDDRDARSPSLLPSNNKHYSVKNQGSLQLPNQQLFSPVQSGQSPNFNAGQRQSGFRGQQQLSSGLQQQPTFGSQQRPNFAGQPSLGNLNQQNNLGFGQQFASQNQQPFRRQNQQQFGQNPFSFGQQSQNNFGQQQHNAFLNQAQVHHQQQFGGNQQGQNFAGFPHQGLAGFSNQQSSSIKHSAAHGGGQASQGEKGYAGKNQQGQHQGGFRSQNQHNNQQRGFNQQAFQHPTFGGQNNQQRGFNQQGIQHQPNFGAQQLQFGGQPGFVNNQRLQGQFNPQHPNHFRNQNQLGPFTGPQSFGSPGQLTLRQPVVGLFSNKSPTRACNTNDPTCNRATHLGIFYPIRK